MKNLNITKITYHYLSEVTHIDPPDNYNINPCLNIFYRTKLGRRKVIMINPTWNDITFLSEKEYWKRGYKGGFTLEQGLWEIPEVSEGYRTGLILNHFVHWLGLEKRLDP